MDRVWTSKVVLYFSKMSGFLRKVRPGTSPASIRERIAVGESSVVDCIDSDYRMLKRRKCQ